MANNYGSGGGNVGAADAAVLALLADTSRAGRGGMFGGGFGGEGGGFVGSPFASFGSNAVRTNAVNEQVVRNGQDAHFFALSGEDRSHFNILNQQMHTSQLATQAQISQLALQLCECCGDQKAALGRIEGRLDCVEGSIKDEINLCINNQTIVNLQNIIAELRNYDGKKKD
ncbi:hypothetical protein LCGC14_2691420 [marine sediment metagenome]|uniref:Uncharacterized protein n=1 Tax=marine sediment metagenome TaxID=412755 RepID=A0A0F9CA69_9ZZZZ